MSFRSDSASNPVLRDPTGRGLEYLRLSITDACNFRCVYCLPQGYRAQPGREPELSPLEIRRLVAAFAELGFWKVRLTGGEPTTRRDFLWVASQVAAIPGIRSVALSTNGHRLKQLAPELRAAGVTAVNVSVDSLDADRFSRITGTDRLADVVQGVEDCVRLGFDSVKINAVLLKDLNDKDLEGLIQWTRSLPISVRFIELMRTGGNREFFEAHHLSAGTLRLRLLSAGWRQQPRGAGGGPAVVFSHPDHAGTVGLIAPYSQEFCAGCNRLRVTSRGQLRLCLFGESDYSLRPWLASDEQKPELVGRIRALIERKPLSHHLSEGKHGNTWNLASIGG